MAEVLLKNLTKVFDEVVAVHDVNLKIDDREFIVLVGPSGCGKSTTLRMIAGLEVVTEGEIYIGERFINNLPPRDRDIAMVFQSYALYPHMRVFDNMAFGLKMRKVPKIEIKQKVKESADILGISDLLDRKPRQLSGGQRQRVALGRAIVRDPQVFLFDEPLSNLDAKLRVQMRTELKKLHERLKATAIYVTHDQVEAMTMGDRIVVMKDGVVQQVGSPLELYDRPQNLFVAGFIGSPAMNFIDCRLEKSAEGIFIDTGDFRLRVPDGPPAESAASVEETDFIFGIRPEDFHEVRGGEGEGVADRMVDAEVTVVELLGREVQLSINTGHQEITAVVEADTPVKVHENIKLAVNMDKAHLFQKVSGEAVF